MAGQVCRPSGGRPARRAADPEMVERRRAGGWETDTGGRRDAPGRKCFAAFGKRLSSLRCARINLVLPAGEIPVPTRGAAASSGIESWVGGGNESDQA